MRGFHHRRRRLLTAPLPQRSAIAGGMTALLLLCLLALSSSAGAHPADPAASLPGASVTFTGTGTSSQLGRVTSAATTTTPTPGATQAASASDPSANADAGANAGNIVQASLRHVRARSAPLNAGLQTTVKRTASTVVSEPPVKEAVAPALATVRHAVGEEVTSAAAKGSTLIRGAVAKTTTALDPATSAIGAAGTAKRSATATGRDALVALRASSEPRRTTGAIPGAADTSHGVATLAATDRLEPREVPPIPSRDRPNTTPAPPRTLSPNAPGAPSAWAFGLHSTTASLPFGTTGSHDRLADERGAADTAIQPEASAAPEPTPSGAVGYSSAATSAGAGGLSTLLLIFGLLSIGGLTATSLLRLASEPRPLAPIALIPERPG